MLLSFKSTLSSRLWNICTLFSICMESQRFVIICLLVVFIFFPWRQNGTSLALKAYPTYRWTAVLSKIKLESRVFRLASLHLRPSSGWTRKRPGLVVKLFQAVHVIIMVTDLFCLTLLYTVFFFFFLIIYLWLPQDDTKDPSLRKHTQKPITHELGSFLNWVYLPCILMLDLSIFLFRFPEWFGIVVLRVDKTSIRDKKSKNWF